MKFHLTGGRRWVVLLATVAGILSTGSMGLWQIDRARQKQSLHDARVRLQAVAPVNASALFAQSDAGDPVSLHYRRVLVRGQWLKDHTVFLDNRQMNARPGFVVLTPLALADTQVILLVQRGWVPRAFTDRTLLPALPTPEGIVEIQGHLAPWPSRIYDFGQEETGPIRQNLERDAYLRQTGLSMPDLSVQQTGGEDAGFLRDWPIVVSGVEKHHGYAFQWFGLSALIALLYVWFQIVQPYRQARAL
jgi:surfeit locus 1 family protein